MVLWEYWNRARQWKRVELPVKNEKALMVIDMQEDYIGERSRFQGYPDLLIEMVNERIERAVREGISVIYIRNKGRKNRGAYVPDFVDGLILASEFRLEKDRVSAFANPELMELLKRLGVSAVEIIGIDGNSCVAATALDACRLGFAVMLPLKYIGVKDRQRFQRTRDKLVRCDIRVLE